MKKASPKILLILCIVLVVALVASLIALISVKDEVDASSAQIQILMDRVQALEEENRALQLQLSFKDSVQFPIQTEPAAEEPYCSLMVESWTIQEDVLAVNAFAQAVLPENATPSAQIELWCGSAVLASQPIILDIGEADGIFEADVAASFRIPEIGAGEELQLWLIVESVGCDTLFTCGAGWYLENGQLMLITG